MIRTFYRILVATLALGATLTLSQSVALADDMLTFIGPTPSLSLGGEYTSPYVFNINNVNTPVLLVCDDFYSNIWVGDSWTANRISLAEAGGTNGQGKFAYQNNSDSQEYYNEAGWLAQQLMSTRDPLLSEQYSWAIWEIFALGTPGGTDIASANLGSGDYDAVKNLMAKASAMQGGADLSDVYVYTPVLTSDGLASGPNNGTAHTAQEFFFVPEASSPAFLVFNLLALPGILFLLRRRCLRG